jgi:hypothetical protein
VLSAAALTGPFSRMRRAILARVLLSPPICVWALAGMPLPAAAPTVLAAPETAPVMPTYFTTSVWRKSMPARKRSR